MHKVKGFQTKLHTAIKNNYQLSFSYHNKNMEKNMKRKSKEDTIWNVICFLKINNNLLNKKDLKRKTLEELNKIKKSKFPLSKSLNLSIIRIGILSGIFAIDGDNITENKIRDLRTLFHQDAGDAIDGERDVKKFNELLNIGIEDALEDECSVESFYLRNESEDSYGEKRETTGEMNGVLGEFFKNGEIIKDENRFILLITVLRE